MTTTRKENESLASGRGRGAELLGLNGAVSVEEFEAVRQGLDPRTKAFLRARQSADRIAPDGTTLAHGRSLYDFTFSAPKSVSILAILNNDPRLTDAHRTAVEEALGEAEMQASARVRQRGSNADRLTGNLVVAVYHHDASRELDPQIHTHAVAANMTFDGIEGRWKALQASAIYQNRAYLTEVYRNALARQVRSLGYEIESKRDGKGNDCGFEIRGVPRDLIEKFSERSRQRDRAIAVFADRNGRRPTKQRDCCFGAGIAGCQVGGDLNRGAKKETAGQAEPGGRAHLTGASRRPSVSLATY